MSGLRKTLKSLLPQRLVDQVRSRSPLGALEVFARPYLHPSYSQDGEDLLVLGMLAEPRQPGFYVDVGAHHPARYSNTLLFYLKGWRGLNLDPLPGCMDLFKKTRPLDINLEIGISDTEGEAIYYMFNDPAMNSFSEELSRSRNNWCHYRLERQVRVPTRPLRSVFAEHIPPDAQITFLTIDVEGMDLLALKSNDWSRWRPTMVITEDLTSSLLMEAEQTELGRFMCSVGYVACARTRLSVLFVEPGSLEKSKAGIKIRPGGQNQQGGLPLPPAASAGGTHPQVINPR